MSIIRQNPSGHLEGSSGAIPASGRSDLSFFLAPQAIPGLTLAWQALVGGSLSNGFDTTVLP